MVKIKLDDFPLADFTKRLDTLRSAMSFHIVASLKTDVRSNHVSTTKKLDILQQDMETLIRIFQNDNRTVDTLVKDHGGLVTQFWENNVSQQAKATSKGLTKLLKPESRPDSPQRDLKRDLRSKLSAKIDELEATKRNKVLLGLRYRYMSDREDEVTNAYRQTFEWMFSTEQTDSWDAFPEFLSDKQTKRPYWISGKAGSGKSTLMKFLARDKRTSSCLKAWSSRGGGILTASFFFWNMGTTMQKTQLGLFQALLYQLLSQRPEYIRMVFDDLWPFLDPEETAIQSLSLTEAKRAFYKLMNVRERTCQFCIFVDGIDEFDGDHAELAQALKELAKQDIKVVLSSRPIPACFELFSDCPSLRLESLTQQDIEVYVDGNLASHEYMLELMQDEPAQAASLIREVSGMASGVFLWVKLVVDSLLSGLRNGDNINDLRRRLKKIPPDLEDLFRHMLEQLNPDYRDQACRYFQIFREASRIFDFPFEALDMYFAEAGPVMCRKRQVTAFGKAAATNKCKMLEKRIRSRCCGLLELHYPIADQGYSSFGPRTTARGYDRLLESRVQYLHRSVAEFLYNDEVWSSISTVTATSDFDPHTCLLHAFLAKINRLMDRKDQSLNPELTGAVDALLYCGRRCEQVTALAQSDMVDEIAPFMRRIDRTKGWHLRYLKSMPEHLTKIKGSWSPIQSLFVAAANAGLLQYVRCKLGEKPLDALWDPHVPMLWAVLHDSLPEELQPGLAIRIDIIQTILEHGADPNTEFEGKSFWAEMLSLCAVSSNEQLPRFSKVLKTCTLMGADLNVRVSISGHDYTALALVQKVFLGKADNLKLKLMRNHATRQSDDSEGFSGSSETICELEKTGIDLIQTLRSHGATALVTPSLKQRSDKNFAPVDYVSPTPNSPNRSTYDGSAAHTGINPARSSWYTGMWSFLWPSQRNAATPLPGVTAPAEDAIISPEVKKAIEFYLGVGEGIGNYMNVQDNMGRQAGEYEEDQGGFMDALETQR